MYNILYILVLFASALENTIPGMNYWDEAMVLIIPVIVLIRNSFLLSKTFLRRMRLPILILFIGILGNLLHPGIQYSNVAIFKDVLAFLKFPVVFYSLQHLPASKKRDRAVHNAAKISKIIIVLTLMVAAVGYFIDLDVYMDEVRIVRCFKFIFSHPTFMVSTYVMILCVLLADKIKGNRLYLILDCIIIFLGQRTKGYLVIILTLAILFIKQETVLHIFNNVKGKFRIRPRYIILLGVLILGAGWTLGRFKFALYFSYGLTATRPALYIIGLKIAFDMFPLGLGFGTFASSLSGEYYSNAYHMYGISTVLGMTPEEHGYIGDTFWPYIYGQFGFISMFIYIKMLWNMFKGQLAKIRSYNKILALIIAWAYVLFATTAEAYFTNSTGLQFAMIVSIYICNESVYEHYAEENSALKG